MGIIIGDTLKLNNGLTVKNAYGTIGSESIVIRKETTTDYKTNVTNETNGTNGTNEIIETHIIKYHVLGHGRIWVSKDFRNENKEVLLADNLRLSFDDTSFLTQNIYKLLYDEWKKKYSNVSDDL